MLKKWWWLESLVLIIAAFFALKELANLAFLCVSVYLAIFAVRQVARLLNQNQELSSGSL